jgi:hypothetical protein
MTNFVNFDIIVIFYEFYKILIKSQISFQPLKINQHSRG